MAKAFEDSDVWLSDGVPGDKGVGDGKVSRKYCFPTEFPFEFAANLDSPVESVTETEASDEDGEDYLAGLTKQMARYFLHDADKQVAADAAEAMAGSPQSTLCAWSASSNKRSSNGPSLASSPMEQRGKGKDPSVLLHEADGQGMLRCINELGHRESILDRGNSNRTSPVPTSPKKASAGYFSTNPAFTPTQLQAAHADHFIRQQSIKQQRSAAWAKQSKVKSGGGASGENILYCRPLDLPASAWPPLRKSPPSQAQAQAKAQQQKPPPSSLPGRSMRAVFLHAAGAKKESAGTGVFLPRTVGNKLDPKKKAGCSTILVPDRVVQALNLNLEDFAAQPRFPGGFVLSHDVLIGRSNAHRKTQHMQPVATPVPPRVAAVAAVPESRLPQEWTY